MSTRPLHHRLIAWKDSTFAAHRHLHRGLTRRFVLTVHDVSRHHHPDVTKRSASIILVSALDEPKKLHFVPHHHRLHVRENCIQNIGMSLVQDLWNVDGLSRHHYIESKSAWRVTKRTLRTTNVAAWSKSEAGKVLMRTVSRLTLSMKDEK